MKLLSQVITYNKAAKTTAPHNITTFKPFFWVEKQIQLQRHVDSISRAWHSKDADIVTNEVSETIYTLMSLLCEMGVEDKLEECFSRVHQQRMNSLKAPDTHGGTDVSQVA